MLTSWIEQIWSSVCASADLTCVARFCGAEKEASRSHEEDDEADDEPSGLLITAAQFQEVVELKKRFDDVRTELENKQLELEEAVREAARAKATFEHSEKQLQDTITTCAMHFRCAGRFSLRCCTTVTEWRMSKPSPSLCAKPRRILS